MHTGPSRSPAQIYSIEGPSVWHVSYLATQGLPQIGSIKPLPFEYLSAKPYPEARTHQQGKTRLSNGKASIQPWKEGPTGCETRPQIIINLSGKEAAVDMRAHGYSALLP